MRIMTCSPAFAPFQPPVSLPGSELCPPSTFGPTSKTFKLHSRQHCWWVNLFNQIIRIEDDMHTTHPKTDQVLVANSDLPSTFTCCLGSCWIHPGFGADLRNNHEDDVFVNDWRMWQLGTWGSHIHQPCSQLVGVSRNCWSRSGGWRLVDRPYWLHHHHHHHHYHHYHQHHHHHHQDHYWLWPC